jgi:hypothetical protein
VETTVSPKPDPGALGASHILLWIFLVLNIGVGVLMVLALPASFVFEPQFLAFFSKKPPRIDPSWLMPTLRAWIVAGLVMIAVVHIIFTRLLAMVATVRAGDPFVPENAARLMTIAWCALSIELLRLLFGLFASTMNAAGSNIPYDYSLTGWLAVALTFVLARVFEHGTRMRDDLGTMI